jgi:hypothetical protein
VVLRGGWLVSCRPTAAVNSLAAMGFCEERREIVFNDPWPGRFADGGGFNRRMSETEFKANTKPYRIVYG